MQGDIPPQMNVPSSRRVVQLFGMLQTKVRENAENVKSETEYMAACSSRVHRMNTIITPSDKSEFPGQSSRLITIPDDGYDEGRFFDMPGVNPLDLPHATFSKELFEKNSSKPQAVISKPGTIDL